MIDYSLYIGRAIASLPHGDARGRRLVYKRSRMIVLEQLRKADPNGNSTRIRQELAALETAIRKIEAEAIRHSRLSSGLKNGFLASFGRSLKQQLLHRLGTKFAPIAILPYYDKSVPKEAAELGGVPASLAVMLLALTFGVGAIAFIGVIYLRATALGSTSIAGYPLLLLLSTFVFFAVGSFLFFHKTSPLMPVGILLRILTLRVRNDA